MRSILIANQSREGFTLAAGASDWSYPCGTPGDQGREHNRLKESRHSLDQRDHRFEPGLTIMNAFGSRDPGKASFTLVEVVLALGIFTFVLVTVLALLSVALRTNKESSDQIQAANIASLLVAARRSAPTNAGVYFSTFALPNLNQSMVTNTTTVGLDGTTNTTTGTTYNLYYVAGTNQTTGPNMADVYLLIWRPLGAEMPTNNPSAYYELSTQVSLQ